MGQPTNQFIWFSNKETTNKLISVKETCILKYVNKHDYNLGLHVCILMQDLCFEIHIKTHKLGFKGDLQLQNHQ